jgi:hypothetical protein
MATTIEGKRHLIDERNPSRSLRRHSDPQLRKSGRLQRPEKNWVKVLGTLNEYQALLFVGREGAPSETWWD